VRRSGVRAGASGASLRAGDVTWRPADQSGPGVSLLPVSFPAARPGGRHIARGPVVAAAACVYIVVTRFSHVFASWPVAPRILVAGVTLRTGARVPRTRRARNG